MKKLLIWSFLIWIVLSACLTNIIIVKEKNKLLKVKAKVIERLKLVFWKNKTLFSLLINQPLFVKMLTHLPPESSLKFLQIIPQNWLFLHQPQCPQRKSFQIQLSWSNKEIQDLKYFKWNLNSSRSVVNTVALKDKLSSLILELKVKINLKLL